VRGVSSGAERKKEQQMKAYRHVFVGLVLSGVAVRDEPAAPGEQTKKRNVPTNLAKRS
jgi:hypothetical protein